MKESNIHIAAFERCKFLWYRKIQRSFFLLQKNNESLSKRIKSLLFWLKYVQYSKRKVNCESWRVQMKGGGYNESV